MCVCVCVCVCVYCNRNIYKTLLQVADNQKHIVVESGNLQLGQLLWCDPLKHDTDDLISEKFSLHWTHVMVLEYGCLVLVAILSARRL